MSSIELPILYTMAPVVFCATGRNLPGACLDFSDCMSCCLHRGACSHSEPVRWYSSFLEPSSTPRSFKAWFTMLKVSFCVRPSLTLLRSISPSEHWRSWSEQCELTPHRQSVLQHINCIGYMRYFVRLSIYLPLLFTYFLLYIYWFSGCLSSSIAFL